MKTIQHHIFGIKATFETLSKGKLLIFFLPGLVIGIVYLGVFSYTEGYRTYAESFRDVWFIGDWIADTIHQAVSFGQAMLLLLFKFFVITLLSPFNNALSARFDTALTGTVFKMTLLRFVSDILRAIIVVSMALFLQVFFLAFWWSFSSLAGISIVNPVAYFLISSFFFGFAFYDYSLERHGTGTFGSLGFAFRKTGTMLLTGAIFSLIFLVPFVGIIAAPVLATLIATGVYVHMHRQPSAPPEIR